MAFFGVYLAAQVLVSAYGLCHGDWFAWRMFASAGHKLEARIRYVDGHEETWETFQARTGKGRTIRNEAARGRFVATYLCAAAEGAAASVEVLEDGRQESYPCRR